MARQPFFRHYPRLLIYETGVHFIDTFRYLLGEPETVYARLRRLNPDILGEDSGQVVLGFGDGATAMLDANRYNENEARNPRLTFGELRIDGSKGHLTLDYEGDIVLKPLGQSSYRHDYPHEDTGFAGGCVHAVQTHFVEQFLSGEPFESTGEDYLEDYQGRRGMLCLGGERSRHRPDLVARHLCRSSSARQIERATT